MSGPERPVRIAVCGAGVADDELADRAERLGRAIASVGAVLVCGGLGGVMEAAARGSAQAGGLTVGVLPGRDGADANVWIRIPLPTGMGEIRNALVVRFADVVIAVGGEWGTLSEIALARKMGIPVVLMGPGPADGMGLETSDDADAAVRLALDRVHRRP
jgi:uncharacterized protein (TIGR00725 family)